MEYLKQKILKEGIIKEGCILKVDSFLNHQIDVEFLNEVGKEFKRRFSDKEVTKILTVEASGIAIAVMTAQYFNVPVLFAKKVESSNMDESTYESEVYSYTRGKTYKRNYLSKDDKVLVIDDFLANGSAALGLVSLVESAGAELSGIGIVIEKSFQDGGKKLREKGINLHSLARVEFDSENNIVFK